MVPAQERLPGGVPREGKWAEIAFAVLADNCTPVAPFAELFN
jgi:hypothetical protein